tara:strand:- start:7209 stop:8111 length:903 start_codon:yes stop_codon:yes gene_type:complete
MFNQFKKININTSGAKINLVYGGKGEPVLLLHGYPQTHVMWHKIAPALAEQFSVVIPDLRGYGDSSKPFEEGNLEIYCKRNMAKDPVEVMEKLGFSSYHVVGHDRGARVGLRLALDFPDRVLSFTPLDVVPSETAFRNMNSDLSFAWFHWHLMRQPYPLPETLIGNSAKVYLDFLFERWTAVEGAITNEAYQEYLRCFNNTETIRSTCLDYRSVEQDILHDQLDLKNKLKCPVLVLWAGNMQKRKGWQTGNVLNMIDVWKERAENVIGRSIDSGHFLPEESPDDVLIELVNFFNHINDRK